MENENGKHVCAEIVYEKADVGPVHSDLCATYSGAPEKSSEWRKMLHDCLDEYLDSMNDPENLGYFFVGDKDEIQYNSLGMLTETLENRFTRMIEIDKRFERDRRDLARLRKMEESMNSEQ